MKYCSKCGKPYEEGSKFCNECGSPLSSAVEVENPLQTAVEVENPVEENDGVTNNFIEKEAPKADKKVISKKLIIIGSSVLLVVALAIVIILFAKSGIFAGSAEEKDISLTYIKDNKEVHYLGEDYKKSLILTSSIVDSEDQYTREIICDRLTQYGFLTQKSPSGEKVAYLSAIDENTFSGDLYIQKTSESNTEEDGAGVQISARVLIYDFIDENQIAYIKMAEGENSKVTGDLYIYNISEDNSSKISTNIDFFAVSEDSGTLLLIKNASEENYMSTCDLYLQEIDEKAEKTKIDSEVFQINDFKPDFSEFIYLKAAGEDEFNYDIYRYNAGSGKKKVASNVYYIESAYAGGNIYYYKSYDEILSLEDVINDNMATKDAETSEPDYYDFITTETEYDYYYEEYYYYETVDYDAYDAAYANYEEKLARDEIRNYIYENPMTVTKTDLYCISKDNKETKIDSNVDTVVFENQESGGFVYSKKEAKAGEKINMSELTSLYDIPYYSMDETNNYSYYVYVPDQKPMLLFSNKSAYENISLSADLSKVYYLYKKADKENGTLYGFEIKNNEIRDKKEIRTDVGDIDVQEDGSLLIIADQKDSVGDLYIMQDEEEKSLGNDVSFSSVLYLEDNDIYFIDNYDKATQSGELRHFADGSKTTIDKDVFDYFYFRNDLIYLYKDYNDSRFVWDIYKYDGGEEIINIDYDVSNVQYNSEISLQAIINILDRSGDY